MRTLAHAFGAGLLLAGCGSPTPAPAPSPTREPSPAAADPTPVSTPETAAAGPDAPGQDAYLGRWTGVEGMVLDVAARPAGGVAMEMQWDLDHRGRFDGSVTAEGLRFMRGGVAETAVLTDGNATGLKYLAGKKTCLTVKPGEGYCRD